MEALSAESNGKVKDTPTPMKELLYKVSVSLESRNIALHLNTNVLAGSIWSS